MAKKPLKVKASVGSATCSFFCTSPMRCPLCRILVPANTPHRCESKGSK